MSARVDIINRALMKIGATPINDPNEPSPQARAAALLFDAVARTELRKHAWSFALARAVLPALAEAPAWGYANAFQLPAECLRLVYINDIYFDPTMREISGESYQPWAIEGLRILTDVAAPLHIRYVADVSDPPDLWDAAFEDAFACALARDLAPNLTKSTKAVESVNGLYRQSIFDARRCNAIELPPASIPDSSWVAARII